MNFSNKRTIPVSIPEQYNFEHIATSKHRAYLREYVFRNQITTNSYEDSLIVDCRLFEKKLFEILNKDSANALLFKILACTDPNLGWTEIKSETSLAAGAKTYEWDTEPWAYVKIQVKSAVADTPAKVDAIIACQS
jgi:hypothetical protein